MSWRTDAHSPTTPHLADEQVAELLRDEVEALRDEVARLDARATNARAALRQLELAVPVIATMSNDLRIDLSSRQVFVEQVEISLTPIEFDLLAQLGGRPRQVFSREHLLQTVWESNPDWQSLATVTEHVRRLRRKLGPASQHIVTVFGRGYRFDK